MHPCPVHHCKDSEVPDEHLMCRRHWFMVPLPMQDAVVKAYRQLSRVLSRGVPDASLRAATALREAQEAATRYVNDRQEATR